jgi:hypothetical protein
MLNIFLLEKVNLKKGRAIPAVREKRNRGVHAGKSVNSGIISGRHTCDSTAS